MKLDVRIGALALTTAMFFLAMAPPALAKDDQRCSYRTVAGTFGYAATGVRTGVGSVASAGTVTFAEDGNMEGQQTTSFNGLIVSETYSGTYSVSHDCHGSFTVVVTSSNPALNRTTTVDVVWEDDSNAAHAVFTSPQTVITVDARRLFRRHD